MTKVKTFRKQNRNRSKNKLYGGRSRNRRANKTFSKRVKSRLRYKRKTQTKRFKKNYAKKSRHMQKRFRSVQKGGSVAMEDNFPDDWEEYEHKKTGRTYYYSPSRELSTFIQKNTGSPPRKTGTFLRHRPAPPDGYDEAPSFQGFVLGIGPNYREMSVENRKKAVKLANTVGANRPSTEATLGEMGLEDGEIMRLLDGYHWLIDPAVFRSGTESQDTLNRVSKKYRTPRKYNPGITPDV